MFEPEAHAVATRSTTLPQATTRPTVVIGCRFERGIVVRRPERGVYYEVMPTDIGSEAERLQRALLARRKERRITAAMRRCISLFDRAFHAMTRTVFM